MLATTEAIRRCRFVRAATPCPPRRVVQHNFATTCADARAPRAPTFIFSYRPARRPTSDPAVSERDSRDILAGLLPFICHVVAVARVMGSRPAGPPKPGRRNLRSENGYRGLACRLERP